MCIKSVELNLTEKEAIAIAGTPAEPVSHYSRLRYRAPEEVADPALPPDAQPPVDVCAAADMWSIGVIAVELLAQEAVFPPDANTEEMMVALRTGGLPWEQDVAGQQERCLKLRSLKRVVLACLNRDATQRPTAKAMLSLVEGMLDSSTSPGTFPCVTQAPCMSWDLYQQAVATASTLTSQYEAFDGSHHPRSLRVGGDDFTGATFVSADDTFTISDDNMTHQSAAATFEASDSERRDASEFRCQSSSVYMPPI